MKIEELKPDASFDELKVRILSIDGPRQVQSRDRVLHVWDLLVADETGTTTMTLWGAKTGEEYKVQQVVSITEGWCKMFRDKKQISLGRGGKIFPAKDDDPNLPTKIPE